MVSAIKDFPATYAAPFGSRHAEKQVVLVNCTADTFTPTQSGAIGTCVWELAKAADRSGVQSFIISRSSEVPSYVRPDVHLLEYPSVPAIRGVGRLFRLQQRLMGWAHVRQGSYLRRIAATVERLGLQKGRFLLQNDLELAVFLRDRFPKAFILHHAQNCNTASRRYRRRFGKVVNVASAVSDYCADWNSEYFQTQVQTVLSGVDGARFHPAAEESSTKPVINFVGRVDASKGPDILLEAALLLAESTKEFAIQLLGTNFYGRSQMDSFQAEIATAADRLTALGIEVRRPGWISREELPKELRKAQIHVVPARWDEPFGLTTLEGMACGLATVASRTGGTPEVAGEGALLFERGNARELAEHLRKLVTDAEVRSSWARRARERAEYLTWDRTWAEFRELMDV